jgi:hypothetical protein
MMNILQFLLMHSNYLLLHLQHLLDKIDFYRESCIQKMMHLLLLLHLHLDIYHKNHHLLFLLHHHQLLPSMLH